MSTALTLGVRLCNANCSVRGLNIQGDFRERLFILFFCGQYTLYVTVTQLGKDDASSYFLPPPLQIYFKKYQQSFKIGVG